MNIIKTDIEGVLILEPRMFKDERGYFYESFSHREFEESVCRTTFVQDNQSIKFIVNRKTIQENHIISQYKYWYQRNA